MLRLAIILAAALALAGCGRADLKAAYYACPHDSLGCELRVACEHSSGGYDPYRCEAARRRQEAAQGRRG